MFSRGYNISLKAKGVRNNFRTSATYRSYPAESAECLTLNVSINVMEFWESITICASLSKNAENEYFFKPFLFLV